MDPKRECTCLPEARKRYRDKISGPLLDRIDIQVSVPPIETKSFEGNPKGESSASIRSRVCKARDIQRERFAGTTYRSNAEMSSDAAHRFAEMSKGTEKFAITERGQGSRGCDEGRIRFLEIAVQSRGRR